MASMFDEHPNLEQNQPGGVAQGTGSGLCVRRYYGHILTNNHVVWTADEDRRHLPRRRESWSAKVVGTDPKTDVAVIKVDSNSYHAAARGKSSTLKVGDAGSGRRLAVRPGSDA